MLRFRNLTRSLSSPFNFTDFSADFENVESVMCTRYLLKGFRILGVHLPKRHRTLYLIYSFILNITITVYVPIGFVIGFISLAGEEFDIGNFLTSLQAALNLIGCATKITLMAWLLPQLLNCEPVLRKMDKRCSTPEELNKIKDLIKRGNRFVVLFTVTYWSYASCTCIVAAILHVLPYNIHNPLLDAKASNLQFYLAVLMELFAAIVVCFQQVVDDSYAVIYVNILRTHLDILMQRISKLNADTEKSLEENLEELKLCIIDHKNIIDLYNRVAAIISITFFVQFTITVVVLSTTLVNIMLFTTNFASAVASCLYVFSLCIETFPMCYYAQCLMDESNRLSDVIFHSDWIGQSQSYRKMLVFFQQRAQCTLEFSAGKLFPITLNSFLSIAKFSFSVYTLVEEMDIKEKFAK